MHLFEQFWRQKRPNSFPVGYMMRWANEPNCLRFHSLPQSKRYADSDEEKAILLARQNQLAAEVLDFRTPIWLVQTCWETPDGMDDVSDTNIPFKASQQFGHTEAFQFSTDEGEVSWKVNAGEVCWQTGVFDALLLAIANEEAAPTIWISPSSGSVFAPYDGGVDLFLPSIDEVCNLRAKHPDWLSPHPDGL